MTKRVAIYPGSFDPLSKGHINVIDRGAAIFDEIIVAVAHNTTKETTFSLEERVDMLHEIFCNRPEIHVDHFEGLLVHYAEHIGTNIVLRGMRTVSDFEYELRMSLANKALYPKLETVILVTESNYGHISSSLIKEIVRFGGSVADMVPEIVEIRLKEKLFNNKSKEQKRI